MSDTDDLPALVQRWTDGDREAFDRLTEVLYDDLRAIAHRHLRSERSDHTLTTTALVHEAYVELSGRTGPAWRGRAQFFALLSKIMRNVLVDYARRRQAGKRGGDERTISPVGLTPPLFYAGAFADNSLPSSIPLGPELIGNSVRMAFTNPLQDIQLLGELTSPGAPAPIPDAGGRRCRRGGPRRRKRRRAATCRPSHNGIVSAVMASVADSVTSPEKP